MSENTKEEVTETGTAGYLLIIQYGYIRMASVQ